MPKYRLIPVESLYLFWKLRRECRERFSGGHKAFLWAWLDKYSDEDVRIAVQPISHWKNPALLLELEAIVLRATEPPYNVQIPPER